MTDACCLVFRRRTSLDIAKTLTDSIENKIQLI